MSCISRNLDLCRSQKYQVCPVSVIIAQENAAYRWAVGEEMRQRVTAKDGGVSSVAIEDIPISACSRKKETYVEKKVATYLFPIL